MRSWNVAMVGATGVGKTSLVKRYVDNDFSINTIATFGVKVDKKIIASHSSPAVLMLWDLAGDDEYILSKEPVKAARLQDRRTSNSHAYILVADVSRRATLTEAIARQERIASQEKIAREVAVARATITEAVLHPERVAPEDTVARGNERGAPFVLALNKSDLNEKEFDEADARRAAGNWQIVCTSAKTGEGVTEMFELVADALFRHFGLP
jgi:GTPase SAR1 family protein